MLNDAPKTENESESQYRLAPADIDLKEERQRPDLEGRTEDPILKPLKTKEVKPLSNAYAKTEYHSLRDQTHEVGPRKMVP